MEQFFTTATFALKALMAVAAVVLLVVVPVFIYIWWKATKTNIDDFNRMRQDIRRRFDASDPYERLFGKRQEAVRTQHPSWVEEYSKRPLLLLTVEDMQKHVRGGDTEKDIALLHACAKYGEEMVEFIAGQSIGKVAANCKANVFNAAMIIAADKYTKDIIRTSALEMARKLIIPCLNTPNNIDL